MDGVVHRRMFVRLYSNKLRRAFNTLSALLLLSMSIILVLRTLRRTCGLKTGTRVALCDDLNGDGSG